jgi:hypothetical protein
MVYLSCLDWKDGNGMEQSVTLFDVCWMALKAAKYEASM